MDGPQVSELRLTGSAEDAVAAIRDRLPSDAVVRGEDDGVGRFASDRVVMLVGRGNRRLQLFQGSWRFVKAREGKPQLDVELADGDGGVIAKLTRTPTRKPGPLSHLTNLVGNMATVGALVAAYHLFRKIPLDYDLVVGIGAGGGLVWSAIAWFWPKKENAGLEGMVRRALGPLEAKPDPED